MILKISPFFILSIYLTHALPGDVIFFAKSEFDGVKIFSKRGKETEFSPLTNDTNPPYIDTLTNIDAAKAELREYYAIYILNDEPVGKESEVYKITV